MMKLNYKQIIKLSICITLAVCIFTIPANTEARFRGGSVKDNSVIQALENELEYIKSLVNIKEDITAMQRELSQILDVRSFINDLKQDFVSKINSTYRQGIFAYDNPVKVIEEQIGDYTAVFTREALNKSEEYNQKLADKTDLSALDRITQLLNHSTTILNNAIKITGTVEDKGSMGASQKETVLEATEAEQKIDSTSIKINKTMSELINENTKRESQRDTQKAVPYFSNPEDPDYKKKRNEELEKMGIHNHRLPSFTND
jgi:hypothetical protein